MSYYTIKSKPTGEHFRCLRGGEFCWTRHPQLAHHYEHASVAAASAIVLGFPASSVEIAVHHSGVIGTLPRIAPLKHMSRETLAECRRAGGGV